MQKSLFPLNFGFLTPFVHLSKRWTDLRTKLVLSPAFIVPFVTFTVLLKSRKRDRLQFMNMYDFRGLRTSLSAKIKT